MAIVEGIASSLAAVGFYYLGQCLEKKAETLKSVTRVNQLRGLADILNETSTFPAIVAISGKVSSDSPITCKLSGLKAAILRETEEQIFQVRKGDQWIKNSVFIQSKIKEVPWYLDDGTGRVSLAGEVHTWVTRQFFEESRRTVLEHELDHHRGVKMLGILRIEDMIPIGERLTIVGEALKDNAGTVWIRPPKKGPYYVSMQSIDELISERRWGAWICNWLSIGFANLGASLLTYTLICALPDLKEGHEAQCCKCKH